MSSSLGKNVDQLDDSAKGIEDIKIEDDYEEDENEKAQVKVDDDYVDEVALLDAEVTLSVEELLERKGTALNFKEEGNTLFKEENYTQARAKYTAALRLCPMSYKKERSILFANRGACSMKEGRRKEAIEDCSLALQLNPSYMKALKRRAILYEEDEKFDESLEDYKKILEMDKSDRQAFEAVQRLPGQINERNEKLKAEMLGTLKDLGNKILRPFGLSTENFQLQQDPNTGSYSVNFNKNN